MKDIKVWDLFVRVFHWSLVVAFLSDALVIDEESRLHELVGYVVLALLALRVMWGLIGPKRARFSSFPPSLGAARAHLRDIRSGNAKIHDSHNPIGALMIYNLMLTMVLISGTGYLATTAGFKNSEWVIDVHEVFVNWALISVVLHIAGVILESRRLGVNLVKSMVGGASERDR